MGSGQNGDYIYALGIIFMQRHGGQFQDQCVYCCLRDANVLPGRSFARPDRGGLAQYSWWRSTRCQWRRKEIISEIVKGLILLL